MAGSSKPIEFSPIEELSGKLAPSPDEKRLMRTILEDDKQATEHASVILESINHGIGALTPELLFEQLVKNFKLTKQMAGETILRALTGHDMSQLERNMSIPEFRQEILDRLKQKIQELRQEKLIDKENHPTDRGINLAALLLFTEELDHLKATGYGEQHQKRATMQGEAEDTRPYRKDKYRDIALRKTIRKAARRQHEKVEAEDLEALERQSKGRNTIVYALDASGSMKGEKLAQCKKAGIALAYKAIEQGDTVGIVAFGRQVRAEVQPTKDFAILLREITTIRALEQTDIAATIRKAAEMLSGDATKKHLILITDILPTAGREPEKATLEAVSELAAAGVTVSVIGIRPDQEGRKLAERIAELGKGRFIVARNLDDIDVLVLEDYYATIS